jgi:SAM-dependent methyltransferase
LRQLSPAVQAWEPLSGRLLVSRYGCPMHHVAAEGFKRAANVYDRGRPGYPLEAVTWLVEALRIRPETTVVDVGAGTGKFTAQLVPTEATIIAVEPIDAMRSTLAAHLPTVVALPGTAEALPLETASADAIVAAQAFHWFNVARAVAEFHRVLRDGGRVGVIWNERDTSVDWAGELDAIVEPYRGAGPHPRSQRDVEFGDRFGPPRHADFSHAQLVDLPTLRDRVASMSFVAVLPDAERARVLDRVVELVARHPATAGRAAFSLPYRTHAFWADRRS